MRKVLHIIGNKNTSDLLKKLEPNSEVITWNEMLCNGRTSTDVGSEDFWKKRYNFFKSKYNTDKSSFIEGILKEYRNLCNQKSQNEAVLWFGEDLQSQINMIAIISWLKNYRKDIQISWVKTSMTRATEKELKVRYQSRVLLNRDDTEYADYIWQLYCSDSPLQLEKHTTVAQTQLTALPTILQLHLRRFPSVKNGLNITENNTLTAASQFIGNKKSFITHLISTQSELGYGSQQFEAVIDKLKPLFSSLNPIKINIQGEDVLSNDINMYPILRNEQEYLGGSLKYDFLYYDETNKILKL